MSLVVFDTNAYRELAYQLRGFTEKEKVEWVRKLKDKEIMAGHQKELNFWVLCELLKHLEDEADPAYQNCADALKIALSHCTRAGVLRRGRAIEIDIYRHFNKSDKIEYFDKLLDSVVIIATEFIERGRTELFLTYIPEVRLYIESAADQIRAGMLEVKTELEKTGALGKLAGDGWFDEDKFSLIALSMLHAVGEVEGNISVPDVKLFVDKFFFGLARLSRILLKDPNLEDIRNHVIDAFLCLRIGKSDGRLMVTNDGAGKEDGILKVFSRPDVPQGKGMTREDYYSSIDFEIVPKK